MLTGLVGRVMNPDHAVVTEVQKEAGVGGGGGGRGTKELPLSTGPHSIQSWTPPVGGHPAIRPAPARGLCPPPRLGVDGPQHSAGNRPGQPEG